MNDKALRHRRKAFFCARVPIGGLRGTTGLRCFKNTGEKPLCTGFLHVVEGNYILVSRDFNRRYHLNAIKVSLWPFSHPLGASLQEFYEILWHVGWTFHEISMKEGNHRKIVNCIYIITPEHFHLHGSPFYRPGIALEDGYDMRGVLRDTKSEGCPSSPESGGEVCRQDKGRDRHRPHRIDPSYPDPSYPLTQRTERIIQTVKPSSIYPGLAEK